MAPDTLTLMDDSEDMRQAVQKYASDTDLAVLRLETGSAGAAGLRDTGRSLHVSGYLVGDSRVSGRSTLGNGDDAQVAVGVLAQIAADLLDASASLLSGRNHYAGAALLRQVVEVEYLTWAFAHEKREASDWLNSTHSERMKFFSPTRLRQISDGRFSASDYRHHCEQGGHPVPRAIPLLGNSEIATAQMLLVDLLLHSWRTVDSLIEWVQGRRVHESVPVGLRSTQEMFSSWGSMDPLYKWSISAPSAPPPQDP